MSVRGRLWRPPRQGWKPEGPRPGTPGLGAKHDSPAPAGGPLKSLSSSVGELAHGTQVPLGADSGQNRALASNQRRIFSKVNNPTRNASARGESRTVGQSTRSALGGADDVQRLNPVVAVLLPVDEGRGDSGRDLARMSLAMASAIGG